MAEFATHSGISEMTQRTMCSAIPGMDPHMMFSGVQSEEQHYRCWDADQARATMLQIREHLRVEMRSGQASHEEGRDEGRILVPNVQERSKLR